MFLNFKYMKDYQLVAHGPNLAPPNIFGDPCST